MSVSQYHAKVAKVIIPSVYVTDQIIKSVSLNARQQLDPSIFNSLTFYESLIFQEKKKNWQLVCILKDLLK